MIIQTPWFERKFDFNFPVGLFPVIVERLRGTLPQLEAMTKNIPDDKLSVKKDGKWSVKEIAGHLYDLEELWSSRVNDFLEHKEMLSAADLNNTKTHHANHNSKTISELLNQFSLARNDLIRKIEKFDEATALISSVHPRLKQKMRLIDSLFFIAEHDDHELTKIRQLLLN
jgi:uncharacterized damage-inducible protein DinB